MKKILYCLFCLVLTACSFNLKTTLPQPPKKTAFSSPVPTTMNTLPIDDYSFPSWLKEPKTPVFVETDQNGNSSKIIFTNALTGDYYVFTPKFSYSGFFWFDNMNFGLLSSDKQSGYKIGFAAGKITKEKLNSQKTILRGNIPAALKIIDPTLKEKVVFIDSEDISEHYEAEWANNQTEVLITDRATGTLVWDHKIKGGRYGIQFAWSLVEKNQFILVSGKADENDDFLIHDISLTLYDISTGQTIAEYFGDFGPLKWSPDGKMILYQDPASQFSTYGVVNKKGPCLLILETGASWCFPKISAYKPLEGYQIITTGLYKWAGDSKSFYYVYLLRKDDGTNLPSSELCSYNLQDGNINCVTQGIKELSTQSINAYDISPDNQFIHLCFSSSTILNDYAEDSTEAILNTNNSSYFTWPGINQEDGPRLCAEEILWRPFPQK